MTLLHIGRNVKCMCAREKSNMYFVKGLHTKQKKEEKKKCGVVVRLR